MIKITANTAGARAKLQRVQQGLSPEGIDPVVERVALWAIAQLKLRTPKGKLAGGNTRRAWQGPSKLRAGVRLIENDSKVMRFLEEGTRAHGPVKAKMLYIPLTVRALAGWNKGLIRGQDYILKKWVRGIAALHIVRDVRKEAMVMLKAAMKTHIRELVKA